MRQLFQEEKQTIRMILDEFRFNMALRFENDSKTLLGRLKNDT